MSVAWTRADVIKQVVANLGKLGNRPAPSEVDSDKVDKIIDPVCRSLSSRNIYTFQDTGLEGPTDGAFEEEAVMALCDCLAWAVAPRFGMAGDQALAQLNMKAESDLELIAAPPQTQRVLKIEASVRVQRRRGTYTGL
jgi:hypothetical protein